VTNPRSTLASALRYRLRGRTCALELITAKSNVVTGTSVSDDSAIWAAASCGAAAIIRPVTTDAHGRERIAIRMMYPLLMFSNPFCRRAKFESFAVDLFKDGC
jgi:hypothetical protein